MPGILSRERFKITETFTINKESGEWTISTGENELLQGVTNLEYRDDVPEGEQAEIEGGIGGVADKNFGMVIFTGEANPDNREISGLLENNNYRGNPVPEQIQQKDLSLLWSSSSESSNVEFEFCKGDKGYIQTNNEHHAHYGAPQNGRISRLVITEAGDCGDGSGGDTSEPVTGTVTTSPTKQETGDNPDVIDGSGSSITLRPENSPGTWDYLVYQPLPSGDKTVEVKLEFSERGHLQIDAQRESGDFDHGSETITYLHTDEFGGENIYINKTNGDYTDTDSDYETGKTYTYTLERSGNQISWNIKEEGTELYSYTGEGDDFRRLVFESWECSGLPCDGGTTVYTSPVVEIKNVEISGS
jgi:hypothetical protein